MPGETPSTSCSGTSTPSSRYTSGRPNERPTRSAGRFAPRYSCRGAQPRYHGEISKRLMQAYEQPADVSLGCDICMIPKPKVRTLKPPVPTLTSKCPAPKPTPKSNHPSPLPTINRPRETLYRPPPQVLAHLHAHGYPCDRPA